MEEIEETEEKQLRRNLKSRHIQMIALGCAIGTGLFYGASDTIATVGPGAILSYALGGLFIYFVVRALGEMAVYHPVSASFSEYAYRYWGEFAGFFAGWNYWFLYIGVSMAELSVIGIYVQYWLPDLPTWIPTLILFILITSANLMNVKCFGELEFWGSLIKVSALGLMIVFGLGLLIFGIDIEGSPSSFSNLWAHGGFLPHGIWGLLVSLVVVTFSFGGTELIGITAGEAEDPDRTIPSAVNMTISRILIFYVGAIFVLVCLYPWDLVGSNGSPFVEIFDALGIPAAPDILNVVVIIAVFSAYNSCLYSNARMLHGLALHGDAPKFLARLSKNGIPYCAVLFSSFFVSAVIAICYFLPREAFMYIMSVVTVAVITSWIMILVTHIKFRKYLGDEAKNLTFKMIGYPVIDYISIAYFLMIIVVMTILPSFRHAVLLAPVWFSVIAIGYRLSRKKKA